MTKFDTAKIDKIINHISEYKEDRLDLSSHHLFKNIPEFIDNIPSIEHGSSKYSIILDDVVLKVSRSITRDYCTLEYENYLASIDTDLDFFFPETIFYKQQDGRKFYIQEFIQHDRELLENNFLNIVGQDFIDKICNKDKERYERLLKTHHTRHDHQYHDRTIYSIISSLPESERIKHLMHNYGEDNINKLLLFLREHKINDLNAGNFGYRCNTDKCVIFDFSGYGSFHHHSHNLHKHEKRV